MCGIVGYVGKNKVVEILLNGLKNLEYRGYDSSGIALQGKTSQIIKSVGHISSLEEKIKKTKSGKYILELDNNEKITTYDEVILNNNLLNL